ncbi:hypothetical protein CWI39_0103p0030 [Hamiltosporidium magnivora]|uniref:Uncharacterized protein n=1 Tax=Hamiltosporidium magnivora TaxID=148818 RepID=A0A4V2JWU0_9MICR|nr:hypothetical protein CWI39_0103p0030 [Hamiltosporidium magnivora]
MRGSVRKLQNYSFIFCLLAMFILRGNLYTIEEFDKAISTKFKEMYQVNEEILKYFSDSDFYDIRIKDCCMPLELIELLSDLIRSSNTTFFNIFIEYRCGMLRSSKNPENENIFELKKFGANNFAFGINYIDKKNRAPLYKRLQIGVSKKYLKHLLNTLFKVTLVFRKFYTNIIEFANYCYRCSNANYRFMIFDPELGFRNIVGFPDKKILGRYKTSNITYKQVLHTKLKFSGKLSRHSGGMEDVESILKEKNEIFLKLQGKYDIKSYWRFLNTLPNAELSVESNTDIFSYNLKIFSSLARQRPCKEVAVCFIRELLVEKDYFIECRLLSEESIKDNDFQREYTYNSNFNDQICILKLYFLQNNNEEKIFRLYSSLFKTNEYFEIFTDGEYNITRVVDNVEKSWPSERNASLNEYEWALIVILGEIWLRM